jgi:hypothetical protein
VPVLGVQDITKLDPVIAEELIEKGEGGAKRVVTGNAADGTDPPLFVEITTTLYERFDIRPPKLAELAFDRRGTVRIPLRVKV